VCTLAYCQHKDIACLIHICVFSFVAGEYPTDIYFLFLHLIGELKLHIMKPISRHEEDARVTPALLYAQGHWRGNICHFQVLYILLYIFY
jgi:hypothetical protein